LQLTVLPLHSAPDSPQNQRSLHRVEWPTPQGWIILLFTGQRKHYPVGNPPVPSALGFSSRPSRGHGDKFKKEFPAQVPPDHAGGGGLLALDGYRPDEDKDFATKK
jgi:hypothetical protein